MSASEVNVRAPRKARAIINKMIETKAMTEEALCWLVNATDPFHDSRVTPCGFPDTNTCNTIVQQFNYTTSITGAGVTGGGANPFDVHVFFNPMMIANAGVIGTFISSTEYIPRNSSLGPALTPLPLYGGVNIVAVAGGSDLTSVTVYNANNVCALPTNVAGQCRVIGAAFEVVNTTPDLYRGGAVTCYRSPSTCSTGYIFNTLKYPVCTLALPPTTQSQAQLYPTSVTWGAEEGCYSISTMNSDENPFQMTTNRGVMIQRPPSASELISGSGVPAWSNLLYSTPGSTNNPIMVLPFDINGAIFTGLNPNSTLQVTARYFIERIPTISEPDLLVLTRNPTPYDPMALEIYTRTMSELPVACMVKDNPLGEWFNDVLGALAEYAPAIGTAVGMPGFGAAIGTAAKAAYRPPAPPVPQQQQQQQQQQKKRKRRKRTNRRQGEISAPQRKRANPQQVMKKTT